MTALELFPYEYVGGGFWRRKGVPRGEKAETLHGDEALRALDQLHLDTLAESEAAVNDLKADVRHRIAERTKLLALVELGLGLVNRIRCQAWAGSAADVPDDWEGAAELFAREAAEVLKGRPT